MSESTREGIAGDKPECTLEVAFGGESYTLETGDFRGPVKL